MLLQRLRTETQDLHRQLDHHPLLAALMKPTIDRRHYGHILSKFLGFHRSLEPLLQRHVPQISKIPWLLQDLQSLGFSTATIPNAPNPQWIHDEAAALGSFYVMEGSTLGGQVIARHIAKRLNLSPEHGLAYYSSYGEEVGAHWQQTRERLTQFSNAHGQDDEIIAAARQTFAALANWLDQPSSAAFDESTMLCHP